MSHNEGIYRVNSIKALLAYSLPDSHTVTSVHVRLEAGHGKGPCDGVAGGIKNNMDNLVKSGEVVRNRLQNLKIQIFTAFPIKRQRAH